MALTATQEAEAWIRKLDQVTKKLDAKKRKDILEKAAVPVIQRAQKKAPVGTPRKFAAAKGAVSLRYDTPKATNKLRAPKGKGRIKSFFYRKNLALSIRSLTLKRAKSVIIGPKIGGKARSYGKSSNRVNAFYAQMIYGSARAFYNRIMRPAAQSQGRKAFAIAKRLIGKDVKEFAKQKGLN